MSWQQYLQPFNDKALPPPFCLNLTLFHEEDVFFNLFFVQFQFFIFESKEMEMWLKLSDKSHHKLKHSESIRNF